MERSINFGGKEVHIKIRISEEPGIELGSLWSEGRDLTMASGANHATLSLLTLRKTNQSILHRRTTVVQTLISLG